MLAKSVALDIRVLRKPLDASRTPVVLLRERILKASPCQRTETEGDREREHQHREVLRHTAGTERCADRAENANEPKHLRQGAKQERANKRRSAGQISPKSW